MDLPEAWLRAYLSEKARFWMLPVADEHFLAGSSGAAMGADAAMDLMLDRGLLDGDQARRYAAKGRKEQARRGTWPGAPRETTPVEALAAALGSPEAQISAELRERLASAFALMIRNIFRRHDVVVVLDLGIADVLIDGLSISVEERAVLASRGLPMLARVVAEPPPEPGDKPDGSKESP